MCTKSVKLVDLRTLEDGEIMQDRRMALLELIQKYIPQMRYDRVTR
ncbi:MAG: Rpn family recombination-promoting nuclease/putative transposase [Arsenophonus sp. NEOnobi-MAG3]